MENEPNFNVNILEIIQEMNSFPVGRLGQFDSFIGDIAEKLYDTYEYICELVNTNPIPLTEIEKIRKFLPAIIELFNATYDTEYESHYMDRLQHMLGGMIDDMRTILGEKID